MDYGIAVVCILVYTTRCDSCIRPYLRLSRITIINNIIKKILSTLFTLELLMYPVNLCTMATIKSTSLLNTPNRRLVFGVQLPCWTTHLPLRATIYIYSRYTPTSIPWINFRRYRGYAGRVFSFCFSLF